MSRRDILVVDDEPDIRAALRLALELEGYDVAVATDGREAWDALRGGRVPALVLLDLMMPRMGGTELLRLVRGDPRLRALPVVLVTAFGSVDPEASALAQGTLPKPVTLEALVEVAGRFCAASTG